MQRKSLVIVAVAIIFAATVSAQERRSEVDLQGIWLSGASWSGTSIVGASMSGRASSTGGALLSYRYSFKRWLAAEANYSFASGTEHFSTSAGPFSGRVNKDALTVGIVLKAPSIARLRLTPYALADGGLLIFNPSVADFFTSTTPARQSRGLVAYGGGAHFGITKRVSLVGEFRELRYVAPDFSLQTIKSGILMHRPQPSAGIAFRF